MTEEELVANFSFMTVDEVMDDGNHIRHHRKKPEFVDGQTNKVFVWGLNDFHQLGGGIPDNKVCSHKLLG